MARFSHVIGSQARNGVAASPGRGTFSPERLILARDAKGISQSALAKASGITQGYISKVENGIKDPSPQFVDSVAEALRMPQHFFFRELRKHPLALPFFRRRKTIGAKVLNQLEAQLNLLMEATKLLLNSVDVPDTKLPSLSFDPDLESPSDVARELRVVWGVPHGPLDSVVNLSERLGCLVVPFDFPSHKIDGVSIWAEELLPPMVFLSRKGTGDRQRFSNAHELGHLVLHHMQRPDPNRDLEGEADEFAAELLMPADDIKPELRRLDLDRLAALKVRWRVSMAALIMRAKSLGCITQTQHIALWKKMSRLGYRRVEPIYVAREQDSLFNSVVRVHLEELGYTESSLAEVLAFSVNDVRHFLLRDQPGLRVI